jgi:hypothetical protein
MRLGRSEAPQRLFDNLLASRSSGGLQGWPLAEVELADPQAVLEAGSALMRFSSRSWIGDLDIPSAVVITTEDVTVSPRLQTRLAESLTHATVHQAKGDHAMVVTDIARYLPPFVDALGSVSARASR